MVYYVYHVAHGILCVGEEKTKNKKQTSVLDLVTGVHELNCQKTN